MSLVWNKMLIKIGTFLFMCHELTPPLRRFPCCDILWDKRIGNVDYGVPWQSLKFDASHRIAYILCRFNVKHRWPLKCNSMNWIICVIYVWPDRNENCCESVAWNCFLRVCILKTHVQNRDIWCYLMWCILQLSLLYFVNISIVVKKEIHFINRKENVCNSMFFSNVLCTYAHLIGSFQIMQLNLGMIITISKDGS